ncbi:hypothetical protein [Bacillus sp. SG-1]|nr:hypothetical protein [Bacillus sp. SG-1]
MGQENQKCEGYCAEKRASGQNHKKVGGDEKKLKQTRLYLNKTEDE